MKPSISGTTPGTGSAAAIEHGVMLWMTVCLFAGCSDGPKYPHANVSGRVTVNGRDVEHGKIAFTPREQGKGNGGAADIEQGVYRLTAVPIGENTFTFSAAVLTGKTIPGPGGQPEPERVNCIPRAVLRGGIRREVSADGTLDFSLEGEP